MSKLISSLGWSMHPIERNGQQGFTLMEIMVAMMILALSLTMVVQLFSDGLHSGRLSKSYLQGVYHAKAIMEEVLLVDKFVEGVQQGELEDGYIWTMSVQQQKNEETTTNPSNLMLFNITVTINWQDGAHQKSFSIETLRLGPVIDEGSS